MSRKDANKLESEMRKLGLREEGTSADSSKGRVTWADQEQTPQDTDCDCEFGSVRRSWTELGALVTILQVFDFAV